MTFAIPRKRFASFRAFRINIKVNKNHKKEKCTPAHRQILSLKFMLLLESAIKKIHTLFNWHLMEQDRRMLF